MKKKEEKVLTKVSAKYEQLTDKGAVYLLGVAEGMATQKELSRMEDGADAGKD